MHRLQKQFVLSEWLGLLRQLAQRCAEADAKVVELLVEIEQALRACPKALRPWFGPADLPAQSAGLLASGGHVCFALGLCSTNMSFLVSRSAEGHCMTTVALPEMERESSFVANNLSLAVCGALLCLVVDVMDGGAQQKPTRRRPLN